MGKVAERPKINGEYASWANLRVKVRGEDTISIDFEDIVAVKYKQALTPGKVPGRGPGARGDTIGDYESELSFTLLAGASKKFLQQLKAAAPDGMAGVVHFGVFLDWTPLNGDEDQTIEVEGRGCRLIESSNDSAPGGDPTQREHPLWVTRLFEDGVCLIGEN